MNLFSFTANFGSEESCRLHFKEERDKIGVQCKCGSKEHFWIKSKWSYECKKCRSRISLRSGTIMQSSNLSFLIWYKTMFLCNYSVCNLAIVLKADKMFCPFLMQVSVTDRMMA